MAGLLRGGDKVRDSILGERCFDESIIWRSRHFLSYWSCKIVRR
jgi:hypothetical protein